MLLLLATSEDKENAPYHDSSRTQLQNKATAPEQQHSVLRIGQVLELEQDKAKNLYCDQPVSLSSFPRARVAAICILITTFNYMKIWKPNGLSRTKAGKRSQRTFHGANVALSAVPDTVTLSVFNTQSYYTPNTSSVSMAFQHLSTSLQTSNHSETATGPEVLLVSLTGNTAQDTGTLSLPLALTSVRSAKCPAKKQNLLVMLPALRDSVTPSLGSLG